jgi:hypothetical protein
LPVILHGCETWSLTLREKHRQTEYEMGCAGRHLGVRGMSRDYIVSSLMIHILHLILFG